VGRPELDLPALSIEQRLSFSVNDILSNLEFSYQPELRLEVRKEHIILDGERSIHIFQTRISEADEKIKNIVQFMAPTAPIAAHVNQDVLLLLCGLSDCGSDVCGGVPGGVEERLLLRSVLRGKCACDQNEERGGESAFHVSIIQGWPKLTEPPPDKGDQPADKEADRDRHQSRPQGPL